MINPLDLPGIPLEPSAGSKRGQRYVGPGGERIDNLGELSVDLQTEHRGGPDVVSRVKFQGAKVRKPLLAVSGIVSKGNVVVFSDRGSYIIPGKAKIKNQLHHIVDEAVGRIPLHAKNGVYVMRTWRSDMGPATSGFTRPGSK